MMPEDLSLTDFLTRGTYGFIVFALMIILIFLMISWLTLPFIILKIKNMLIDINIQLMRMNKYLISIEELFKSHTQIKKTEIDDKLLKKKGLTTKEPYKDEDIMDIDFDNIKDTGKESFKKKEDKE